TGGQGRVRGAGRRAVPCPEGGRDPRARHAALAAVSGGRGAGTGGRRARVGRVRRRMAELGVDALLLSLGADLPWLTGYAAMPLERLTMLVLPADADAVLVVPRLEATRVEPRPDLFSLRPWDETDDPVGLGGAEVSADIGRRLRAEGHERVNFAIVGSGPNSASPHHEPGDRVIGPGESVVCDFGGSLDGYCSDITRTVWTGTVEPPAEF